MAGTSMAGTSMAGTSTARPWTARTSTAVLEPPVLERLAVARLLIGLLSIGPSARGQEPRSGPLEGCHMQTEALLAGPGEPDRRLRVGPLPIYFDHDPLAVPGVHNRIAGA
jgi:hypothetical protein